jgi:hypothetical protein
MQTKSFVLAAMLAAALGWAAVASAQMGPPPGYGYSPPGGFPMMGGNPYAPPGLNDGSAGVMSMGMMDPAMMGGPMMAGAVGPMPTQAPAGPGCCTGVAGCGADGCGDGGCGCGPMCGCGGAWCHHINIFGEFLYLRPRNAEIAYAVPIDGNLDPNGQQFQIGAVRVVDPDFSPGFRFGAGFAIGECNRIVATWSQLDSHTQDSIQLPGLGPVVRSLVSPTPPSVNVAADGLFAQADLDTQFKLFDVDYKGLIAYCCDYQLAYVVGARYANLEQHFRSTFEENGVNSVRAESEFDGGGLKFGLEGTRYGNSTQFFVYGKGYASLVAGQFRTRYEYNNQSDPLIVDTTWKAGRVVTMLDLEAGLGWRNHCDNLRFSVGYMFSSWLNVVKTNEWIHTVQQNNFVDPSDNYRGLMTFDGLTARAELLW